MLQKLKKFGIVSLPLLVGLLSTLFVNFNFYKEINLPSIAPPSILFPIVWTILYILMGVSYGILKSNNLTNKRINLISNNFTISYPYKNFKCKNGDIFI